MQLPWNYYSEGDRFFLRSISCLRRKVRRKNDQIYVLRLAKHSDTRRLASQSATIDRHKEFMMAVGSGKILRIAPLVTASINSNEGINELAHRIYRATADTFRESPRYNAKGFTPDERMLGLCALRLGGALIRPLRTSARMPTIEEVEENMDAYTDGKDVPCGPPIPIHQIMVDELKVDERLRWDDKDNMDASLEFGAIEDAEMLVHDINEGKVHLASEATVVALGRLSGDPQEANPLPICISGTCKKATGHDQAEFLRIIHAAVNNRLKHGNSTYRTISVASDGEAKRGLALTLEFMKFNLDKLSPIFPLLKPLEFMNLRVGPDDITPDKDFRHVMKTIRSLLMRKISTNVLGFVITPAIGPSGCLYKSRT
ncbi:hypothetical protein C8J57DRAFT_1679469 [Mycena rebaudengoi]|nr:hypothetical protein C8J57DRAFT_1679469 [Mycena rebaudengoi]